MKRIITTLLSFVMLFSFSTLDISAKDIDYTVPVVLDFVLTTEANPDITDETNTRASGLINSYGIGIGVDGTELIISGRTYCTTDVVRCGFKDLMVQRRASSSDSWKDYYEYGNLYREASAASLSTRLEVASGYQYRVTCKHYAKKSLLVTQSISNTSNIVTVS